MAALHSDTTDSTQNVTPQVNTPPSTSDLPPAVLDLAAKLFDLARNGSTDLLSQYLAAGVPKDLTNASGDTLLMLASYHGNIETVKVLLEAGADPDIINGRGQSVIAGAVFKGWDEVVRVLYEKGADIRLGHPDAVNCARMFGKQDLLELFGVGEEVHGIAEQVQKADRGMGQ